MNGKGSKQRPPDLKRYGQGWDRVFNYDNARIYPCDKCGVLRSKNEGGTTFTVCDDCWNLAKPAKNE